MIQEGVYSGRVWHQRYIPIAHRFQYKILMVAIDLEKIEQSCSPNSMIKNNSFGLMSLRNRDHFPQSANSLIANIRTLLPAHIASQQYRVLLLSQMAHFGFAFNPISFFVVTSLDGKLLGMILEVHNTPWGERHYYPIFDLAEHDGALHSRFRKALHVSPFMPMEFDYGFSLRKNNNTVTVIMDNLQGDTKHFTAGLSLEYQPLKPRTLLQKFIRHPFSPHKTVTAIYWQALKLWIKGVPFCSHPKSADRK